MRGKNNFSQSVRFMFLEDNYYECWWCGQNHANCLHHIFGRGEKEGCEKSVFNSAPLNNMYCHLPNHGVISTEAGKKQMLQKTIDFLESRNYVLQEIDHQFLEKYSVPIYHLGLRI